jgi:hypothetical protein
MLIYIKPCSEPEPSATGSAAEFHTGGRDGDEDGIEAAQPVLAFARRLERAQRLFLGRRQCRGPAGAALAGAAVGIAANFGRKFLMQMPASAAGDWFDALKAEHKATLALFDQIEATDDSQTTMRTPC